VWMANLPRVVCMNFESLAMSNFVRAMEILSDGLAWVLEQCSESSRLYFQHREVHGPYLRE